MRPVEKPEAIVTSLAFGRTLRMPCREAVRVVTR
jgi:hypothetical protein